MRRAACFLVVICVSASGCKKPSAPAPAIDAEWRDEFERNDVGTDWSNTAKGGYELVNGALNAKGAVNHPLWLRRALPEQVEIEFDCWSNSPAADIKVELHGDGRSHARDRGQYTSTGYVVVFGGWDNSKSLIARGNEHGEAVISRSDRKVEPGKRYHWKIVRRKGGVDWYVDNMEQPFLHLDEGEMLSGPDHRYFAINNWESDTWFDNLVIRPLATTK